MSKIELPEYSHRIEDLELRTTRDFYAYPNRLEVVRWYKTEPREIEIYRTGKKEIRDTFCYTIASWNIDRDLDCEVRFIGNRPFELESKEFEDFILLLRIGQVWLENELDKIDDE